MGFPTLVAGRGMVDSDVYAIEKVVNEYDERLYFDRNQDTGQWCIYLKTIPSEPDLPLLGFDTIPHRDDVIKRLHDADTMRHGEEILDGMRRRNKERLKPLQDAASDASGQLAEAMEVVYRRTGDHPSPRIFVPKEV